MKYRIINQIFQRLNLMRDYIKANNTCKLIVKGGIALCSNNEK